MPMYEFVNERLGVKLDVQFPVDERPDEIVLQRKRVPSRVTVGTGAQPQTGGQELLQEYKRLEEQGQFVERPGYYSAKQIKAAAQLPDVQG